MSAYVGTTHSFADRLLRLRPVEAWLSPPYEIAEDDEALVRETFEALFHAVENGTLALELEGAEAAARADEVRLPRPFCDALEAGLRAEFHETEWKICYGLDSLVEGFIRRRDVPPADVPPVPFDATAFRAVSDEFVALAAPVREAPWGPIGSRKPRPLCGGCAAVTTRCKYPARSGGSWLLRLRKRRPGNIPSPGITRHGRCGRPIAIAFETTCVRRPEPIGMA